MTVNPCTVHIENFLEAPVLAQANLGAAKVKARRAGRSQNRYLMRGKRQ